MLNLGDKVAVTVDGKDYEGYLNGCIYLNPKRYSVMPTGKRGLEATLAHKNGIPESEIRWLAPCGKPIPKLDAPVADQVRAA